jgi:hypothetical protein
MIRMQLRRSHSPRLLRTLPWLGVTALLLTAAATAQQDVSAHLAVRNHRFEPVEIHVPANRPVALTVRNLDGADIEFESVSLRVERVIPAGSQGTINLRPLQPGRYTFFDDFHPQTRGTLVVP